MSKPAATKLTPFSVKRKQINFNRLENNNSQTSAESYRHHYGYQTLLQEKETQIQQLKEALDKINQDLQTERHQKRLLENERQQFETSVTKSCSKEKDQVELELKMMKQMHTEKMQYYSSAMNNLYKTTQHLKERLKKYEVNEEEDQDLFYREDHVQYKQEYEFIKNAYGCTLQESHQHPLWSSVQNTTMAIQHEIQNFHAWKSIPMTELVQLLKEDQKSSTIEGWLRELYGKEIPSFERTRENYELCQQLKKFDFQSVEFTSSFVHGHLHLTEHTRQITQSLAMLTAELGLDSTELSSFYSILTKLKSDQLELKHELDSIHQLDYTLDQFQIEANKELNTLQAVCVTSLLVDQPKEIDKEREEESLETTEYDPSEAQHGPISLSQLVELESRVNATERALKENKHVLKTYDALPSDMVLASIKLKETQQVLHELEQQREHLLTNIYSIQ
ncbi:hypothetical protein A0J61_10019 [Choanephora cucurbitarum]|uniref:Uncharacterized protein n=1 Tax=Choanephora cucurbitarum TaxID=101091 RepID=A0A1C7MYQ0_9FUNG|nr:hypothetical protein A0J61_10019 [Choanephora cucurbitarum]